MNALFQGVLNLLGGVPSLFSNAVLQAVPREIYAGIYAGWLKFLLFLELAQWAISTRNEQGLQGVGNILALAVSDTQTAMKDLSGSGLIKAVTQSSTLMLASRQALNAFLPTAEALGFAPINPITRAAITTVKIANIIEVNSPPADPVDPESDPTGDTATAPTVGVPSL